MLLIAPSLICSVERPSLALRTPWLRTACADRYVFACPRPAASSPALLMRRPLERRVIAFCKLRLVWMRLACAFEAEIFETTEKAAMTRFLRESAAGVHASQ